MIIRYIILSLQLFYIVIYTNAQKTDSIHSRQIIKRSFIATAMIGTGFIINNSQLEQNLQTNLRNKVGNTFEYRIDDYIQYAPIAEMYITDIVGIKSKNHWFDQTKYLLVANIITASITHGLKHLTKKTRPNDGSYSFPSGHTTFAFTNATVLYNEFHETSPLLAYSGYVFSTTTGVFRMINNKHWLSDVLVGAGIGILITNLIYYFEPFKNFNPFVKSKNFSFYPQVSGYEYNFYFSYKF